MGGGSLSSITLAGRSYNTEQAVDIIMPPPPQDGG